LNQAKLAQIDKLRTLRRKLAKANQLTTTKTCSFLADWEAARDKLDVKIPHNVEAPKVSIENFSDSDEEAIAEPLCLKQCKRKIKIV